MKWILWRNTDTFGVLPHTDELEEKLKLHLYDGVEGEEVISEFAVVDFSLIEKEEVQHEEKKVVENLNLEETEWMLIQQAMAKSNYIQKEAAKLLGISPRALNYKLKRKYKS